MKYKGNYLFSAGRNCVLLVSALLPMALHAQNAMPAAAADSFLYLKVQLEPKTKPASLKPGEVVEGKLIRTAYWRDKQVLPAGSRVSLIVDKLEQRRRAPNDHWPWVVKAFAPRHEKYPTFRNAHISLPDGRTMDLQVSLSSVTQEVVVRAESRKKGAHPPAATSDAPEATLTVTSTSHEIASNAKTSAGLTATLQALVNAADFPPNAGSQASTSSAETLTVSAGTQVKAVLLNNVSASGSHAGDTFEARLIEPVSVGPTVLLPAGSIVEGEVAKAQKPRMMSRSGSLLLSFTSITDRDGTARRIDASVADVTLERRSHAKVSPEGQIQGDRPGAAWTLINLGMTGGLAKAADDSTQLIVQAIISTATDASTAGTSRIVAACVSGVFMLTRHGRDVVLPKFTEMDITLNRPLVLSAVPPSAVAGNDHGPAQSRMEP